MTAEYLFVVPPSLNISNEIIRLKNKLHCRIGNYRSRNSKPHITIFSVFMDDSREHILVRSLKRVLDYQHPFDIKVNGIGCFESSKTVHMRVKEKKEFVKMCKRILAESYISDMPYRFRFISSEPHLTIGKNLNSQFNYSRDYFRNYSYTNNFTATQAHLLRKYENGKFTKIWQISFGSRPSDQLPLF